MCPRRPRQGFHICWLLRCCRTCASVHTSQKCVPRGQACSGQGKYRWATHTPALLIPLFPNSRRGRRLIRLGGGGHGPNFGALKAPPGAVTFPGGRSKTSFSPAAWCTGTHSIDSRRLRRPQSRTRRDGAEQGRRSWQVRGRQTRPEPPSIAQKVSTCHFVSFCGRPVRSPSLCAALRAIAERRLFLSNFPKKSVTMEDGMCRLLGWAYNRASSRMQIQMSHVANVCWASTFEKSEGSTV